MSANHRSKQRAIQWMDVEVIKKWRNWRRIIIRIAKILFQSGVISRGTRGNSVPIVKVFKNAKKCIRSQDFAYKISKFSREWYLQTTPNAPGAWTQTPIAAWLASVPVVLFYETTTEASPMKLNSRWQTIGPLGSIFSTQTNTHDSQNNESTLAMSKHFLFRVSAHSVCWQVQLLRETGDQSRGLVLHHFRLRSMGSSGWEITKQKLHGRLYGPGAAAAAELATKSQLTVCNMVSWCLLYLYRVRQHVLKSVRFEDQFVVCIHVTNRWNRIYIH